jgi:hypothetical protein
MRGGDSRPFAAMRCTSKPRRLKFTHIAGDRAVPTRSDVYRMNAEHCRIRAEIAKSKETRAEYLEVAEQWKQLAEDADAIDEARECPGPPPD